MNDVTTIVVTLAAVLSSAGAWQFWQTRMRMKHAERKADNEEHTLFRDDLRERVAILEQKLEEAYDNKARTERKLTEVMTQLAEYKVRLEFLEKENERLKAR